MAAPASGMTTDISTHALREEGDGQADNWWDVGDGFLPTPSARRATAGCRRVCRSICDFYPRPPRGGRHLHLQYALLERVISTHALREEGDKCRLAISPLRILFLPTPSARRAT